MPAARRMRTYEKVVEMDGMSDDGGDGCDGGAGAGDAGGSDGVGGA